MLISLSFLLSLLGTAGYRHYALAKQILDIPNERSAHHLPIPRGGGIVFVVIFLTVMAYQQLMSLALIAITLAVALLGYLDDKYTLTAWTRLACQLTLGGLALYCLGGMPAIQIGSWTLALHGWFTCLGILYLVWMLNLYNFMDGINGIAGFEAITVALGMAGVYLALDLPAAMDSFLILAAVIAGFLVWNFPKAKIFMGDVGSSFLGFLFGIWSLHAAHTHPALFWSWMILLGVFIGDATMTLLLRMLKGEALHLAHSGHAYQHASRRFHSHTVVTLAVCVFNIIWLWPCAFAVGLGYINGVTGLLIAYVPIVALIWFFKFAPQQSLA